ncbi:hypothetical protein DPEC_G00298330 [Dallia pectoralis]|uniref:Uncharacterized protein n=1 Tax=Dallia pectoralis TaxID=75939 RepID=A0ACC2FG58_DALPE|nr:hypothetical protein DPEC_G00298330 [Dallia pectoralis]
MLAFDWPQVYSQPASQPSPLSVPGTQPSRVCHILWIITVPPIFSPVLPEVPAPAGGTPHTLQGTRGQTVGPSVEDWGSSVLPNGPLKSPMNIRKPSGFVLVPMDPETGQITLLSQTLISVGKKIH